MPKSQDETTPSQHDDRIAIIVTLLGFVVLWLINHCEEKRYKETQRQLEEARMMVAPLVKAIPWTDELKH